jgi:hypothetical protein
VTIFAIATPGRNGISGTSRRAIKGEIKDLAQKPPQIQEKECGM